MEIIKGEKSCKYSWQEDFPTTLSCDCRGTCHLAFVAIEEPGKKEEDGWICDSRPEDAELWPHDAIAVAVYICKNCMKTRSIMNQA